MVNIKDLMRPAFANLDGGLFSVTEKADVGDVGQRMKEMGVAMMSWADPFMPDPSIPACVEKAAIDAIKSGTPAHYIMPIGSPDLKELIAERTRHRVYSARTAHPFQRNGALFRLKLSTAQFR